MAVYNGRLVTVGAESPQPSRISITSEDGTKSTVDTSSVILTDAEISAIKDKRSKDLEENNKRFRTPATEQARVNAQAKSEADAKTQQAKKAAEIKAMTPTTPTAITEPTGATGITGITGFTGVTGVTGSVQ